MQPIANIPAAESQQDHKIFLLCVESRTAKNKPFWSALEEVWRREDTRDSAKRCGDKYLKLARLVTSFQQGRPKIHLKCKVQGRESKNSAASKTNSYKQNFGTFVRPFTCVELTGFVWSKTTKGGQLAVKRKSSHVVLFLGFSDSVYILSIALLWPSCLIMIR